LDGRRVDKEALRKKGETAKITLQEWTREELEQLHEYAVNK